MPGRIPEDVIDKIRDEVPIEDVVGHFVPLRQKGTSYWGNCPFHHEKTPSFHVHPERQIFYCFGCHRGGNVFRFLMDKEGMSFPEAVQWCASRLGLDLSRFLSEDEEGDRSRAQLLAANAWAADWFAERLAAPEGAQARQYLRERGLKPETVEAFGLGLAPPDGGSLERSAREAGIGLEALLQANLLGRKEGRAPFAYFRSRLIFPVRGVAQKIQGFGGRILGPGEPKYLNSPETPVFQKRKVLYGLPEARSLIVRRREALLVEGYLDAIALHQGGWSNAVATCGTSFTAEQASQLRRYAERLVILFDGDRAGIKAAFKSADLALTAGLDVRIAELPGGKDPADMVRAGELERLQEIVEGAPDLVQRMLLEVERRGGRRADKERALHHLRSLLSRVPDPIRVELLIQEAARLFGVPPRLLESERREAPGKKASPAGPPPDDDAGVRLERQLLGLALRGGRSARERVLQRRAPEAFGPEELQQICAALGRLPEGVDRIKGSRLPGLAEELEGVVAGLLLSGEAEGGLDVVAEIDAVLERLEDVDRQRAAERRRAGLEEMYRSGDTEGWKDHLRKSQDQTRDRRPTESS